MSQLPNSSSPFPSLAIQDQRSFTALLVIMTPKRARRPYKSSVALAFMAFILPLPSGSVLHDLYPAVALPCPSCPSFPQPVGPIMFVDSSNSCLPSSPFEMFSIPDIIVRIFCSRRSARNSCALGVMVRVAEDIVRGL
jgi:hypothetical protein